MSMMIDPYRIMSAYSIANASYPATNAHLSFTPMADLAKQKQWTVHIPVALAASGQQVLFAAGDGTSTNFVAVQLTATGQLDFAFMSGGIYVGRLTTTRLLRDYGGFYFITCVMDTPNVTADDRMRMYFDLERETSFATNTNPAQDSVTTVFAANTHNFLKLDYAAVYGDVYLGGNTCLIGQALEPTSFVDSIKGQSKAKDLTGLDLQYLFMFDDAVAMGTNSGSAGDATVTGTLNQVTSTPTNITATLDPIDTAWGASRDSSCTLSDGNKRGDYPGAVNYGAHITNIAFTPRNTIYGEALIHSLGSQIAVGLVSEEDKGSFNGATTGFGACLEGWVRGNNGSIWNNGGSTSGYPALAVGDRFIFAFDMANGKGWFGKNGVWDNGVPTLGTSPSFTFSSTSKLWHVLMQGYNGGAATLYMSEADWAYTAPTGFTANTTDNLPWQKGSIKNHFNTVLYSGTSANQSITGVGFQPDFIWAKSRSTASSHRLFDACRGMGVINKELSSDTTVNEGTSQSCALTPTADGWDFSTTGIWEPNDLTGGNYAAWCASLPNTVTSGWSGSPTITPTKEIYNATLGMSIVTYTGDGVAGAIPHSLGKAPGVVLVKRRDVTGYSWMIYHSAMGSGYYGALESTAAFTTAGAASVWNALDPTSTLVHIGTSAQVNASNATYVAYIFAETDFCKIGSYIGNGSADGPLLNTGIRPVWELVKYSNGIFGWYIFDEMRSTYNPLGKILVANGSGAEGTDTGCDFLSNGVKVRSASTLHNASGGKYIYLMFGQPNGPSENTAR